jgi:hypothetical protein
MERTLRLSAIAKLMALMLGLAAGSGLYAQSSGSQSQSPSGQEPAQPVQPQAPDKSPDQKSDKDDQDQTPTPPVVAGTSYDAPITGASQPIIGLVASRSYIVPSVYFYGQLDSNASNTSGDYRVASINTLMGSLAVQKVGRASQFNLGYLIGRSFSNANGAYDATTHEGAASELWSRGRWDGFILDRFLYSSQAAFLGGAIPFDATGLNTIAGLSNTGPVILRNSFQPGQGIFTPFGPRLSNILVAQVNNHLSRRTFFTLVGNYNILHFYDASTNSNLPSALQVLGFNLIDSSSAGFQTGIGYQRTRRDTFAGVYRFNDLWYSGFPVRIRDNIFQAAYQRQLGGRLLFQIAAGPEISFIHDPNFSGTSAAASETRVSWALDASLHYELRRGFGVTAGYDHFLSSGSGVFLGAITDRAFAGFNRQLSREWLLTATVNYSHNQNLIPLFNNTVVLAPADATYDSVYGTIVMRRRIGRDAEVFFGYLGRYQTTSFVFCTQGICNGSNITGHQLNFGFSWHLKPVPIG